MLAKFSVRKPFTVLVGVVIVLVLGYLSFGNMSTDFLPSMEMPYAIVMTSYPGASPEEVETTVTSPVESAMSRISGVKEIQSISNANMSIVIMEFEDSTDMNATSIDMRESLDTIRSYWDDTVGNPTIMKINPDMMPILVATINFDGEDAVEVSKKANDNIIPEIESVGGVASVQSVGQIEEKIDVILQQDKIDAMNEKVADALEKQFAKAQEKIDRGQDKIDRGKDELDEKKDEAAGQMAQGASQLTQANTQINDGLAQIDAQIAEIKAQQTKLLESEKEAKKGAAAIKVQKKNLQATIKNLKKAKEQLTQAADSLAKFDDRIAELEEQIRNTSDAGEKAELEAQVASIRLLRSKVVEKLEENGIKESEIPVKLAEIESGLTQAEAGMTEINKQEKELVKGLKQIKTAKKKIAAGLKKLTAMRAQVASGRISTANALEQLNKQQILAGIEMSVAQAGLNSGASEIEKAKTELEKTKKDAKENLDLNKLLTKEMMENILKAENFEMPAGYVTEEDATYLVKVGEKMESEEDIRDLVLLDLDMDDLEPIKLSDVADVIVSNNSDEVYTVVNGKPAVAVILQKQSGYSTGDVTDAVLERFETLKKEYDGLNISVMMNQGIYIDLVTGSVGQNLLFGGALAIVILLLFLWDIRPTIIVACSIPLSLVAAVVAMYFSGVTLNIISLSGLALGVGMLVDNSVVVIENIYRMRQLGVNIRSASILGAKQVIGAIISSTLTTVCVFAPIIFTEGITKQLFVDLGLTLAYTLVASLIIAMTLVPAMSAGMLRRSRTRELRVIRVLQNGYARVLRPVLRLRWLVLLASFALLGLFIWLAVQRGTTMIPEMESPQMTMSLSVDSSKDFDERVDISNEVIERVKTIPDMDTIGAFSGSSNFMSMMTSGSSSGGKSVSLYALLKEDRTMSGSEIQAEIEKRTADLDCELKINMSAMDMSSITGDGVRIDVKGRDIDKLRTITEDLMERIKNINGLKDITNEQENSGEEFRITVNKAKAMRYSLTIAQVFADLRGKVAEASSASKLSTDTNDYQIYVKNSADEELTRDLLRSMKIEYTDAQTQKKKSVKLSKIASFETVSSPTAIKHHGQSRTMSVKAGIDDNVVVDTVAAEVKKVVDAYEAPAGYTIELNGENEATQEAVSQIMLMMLLAVLLMYLIMVAQFQGLLSPFIIMFTIPLAFSGGFLGLWISGTQVSVISLIGFVMLSGIIVNNGIVLVDYTNQLRTMGHGMEKRDAIVEAGRTRLRPILMTAITTILGLIPMVVSKQMGSDMSRPMAIVVIGGLIYGTLLTLFVVPCMYDIFSRKRMRTQAEWEELEAEVSDAELKRLEMSGMTINSQAGEQTETGEGSESETDDESES